MTKAIIRPDFYTDRIAVVDLFKALSPYSIIPDLYDVIGDQRIFFNLLRMMAGLEFKFPPLETIQNLLVAVDVILSIAANPDETIDDVVLTLSQDYGLLPKDILSIYLRARAIVGGGVDSQKDEFSKAVSRMMNQRYKGDGAVERKLKKLLREEETKSKYNIFSNTDPIAVDNSF